MRKDKTELGINANLNLKIVKGRLNISHKAPTKTFHLFLLWDHSLPEKEFLVNLRIACAICNT